jgi:hypothetical protein
VGDNIKSLRVYGYGGIIRQNIGKGRDSSMASTRKEIMKLLCDTQIFPKGFKGNSKQYSQVIVPLLPKDAIANVKDIDKCVREALETIAGYNYSNGSKCNPQRSISRQKSNIPKSPAGYVVEYTMN